jgi:hypothetical protein
MERQNLEGHIANDCPLTVIDCDFKGVGCEVRLPRKDLPSHLTEGLVVHVSLQTKQLLDIKKENKQLKHQVGRLTKDLLEYRTETMLHRAELTMTNFELHKKYRDEWYSPPFYTHQGWIQSLQ